MGASAFTIVRWWSFSQHGALPKVDVNTAATYALKGNPGLLNTWLKGVTTTSGADGLQAVQAQLGIH